MVCMEVILLMGALITSSSGALRLLLQDYSTSGNVNGMRSQSVKFMTSFFLKKTYVFFSHQATEVAA